MPADVEPTIVGADFDTVFAERRAEADEFYAAIVPPARQRTARRCHAAGACRAAVVEAVLPLRRQANGSTAIRAQPPPPPERRAGRNHEWTHLYNADVISMPDKWEYPWYAAWDLAFHCVPLAIVDSDFAKEQLLLLAARVVHASQRPAARLRVGVWRRQPARARVGGAGASTRSRRSAAAPATGTFLEQRLPQTAAQLHLVGQPQGRRGHERLPGRVPRPRQHRRLRPQSPAADGRHARAVGRHELDGDVHAQHARDRDGARARRTPPTRTWRASSASTSSTSPMR